MQEEMLRIKRYGVDSSSCVKCVEDKIMERSHSRYNGKEEFETVDIMIPSNGRIEIEAV